MKNLKNILKYIIIYIITVSILFSLLILSSKIPKSSIQKNIEESVTFFKENAGVEEKLKRREYTTVHYYADSILLNIIYSIDSQKPIESTMWAKYYKEVNADINNDFIEVVEENKEPNEQYLRYWHGSMLILRPILTILNIEQIYLLNKIVMYALAIVLLILIFRKSKKLAIIFLISMIMIAFPIVPYCLEYSWTFYIMLITSIIAILIENKGNKNLYILFFISGILTCFFDFLTTEIITVLVPALLVLIIRKEDNRLTNFKDGLKFLAISCTLWGISYVAMWLTKWVLASIILNVNSIEYIKENAMLRINGLQGLNSKKEMYIGALYNNWHNLYPINIVKSKKDLLKYDLAFLGALVLLIDWKNIKKKWFELLLLLVALTPYLRYLVLANHSYRHSFFTFREQIISCIAIITAILEMLNYRILFKKIEWRKNWKK
ncbi:MAG: hypothetical protein ACI4U9_00615 [Clostridia bacterium]